MLSLVRQMRTKKIARMNAYEVKLHVSSQLKARPWFFLCGKLLRHGIFSGLA